MKAFCLVLSLLLLLGFCSTFAQPRHTISLQTGMQRYLTREPILSPLSYRGTYGLIGFAYSYTGKKSYQEGQVLRGTGELTSSVTATTDFGRNHYAELLALQFRYAYLRQYWMGGRYTAYGGLTLRAAYFDKAMTYLQGQDGRAADVFIAPAAIGAVTATYGQRHWVRGQLAVAPLAYVAARTYAANRPPLPLIDQELTVGNALKYGDWLALPRFISIQANANYHYWFGKHWAVRVEYQLQYYRYDKLPPFVVQSVVHSLLAGIAVRL